MTRRYNGCAFFRITSTTMVLLILVEVTWPILVLRRLACVGVVSAIYFFLALAAGFLPLALAAGLAAAAFFGSAATGSAGAASAAAAAWAGRAMFNCFSRMMVWIRATSLRSP